jgi:hypothetical protein
MRIKFLSTQLYESQGRGQGPRYEAGRVYDLPEAFAERWLRRGVAERADPGPADPLAVEPEPLSPEEEKARTPAEGGAESAAPAPSEDSGEKPGAAPKTGKKDPPPSATAQRTL